MTEASPSFAGLRVCVLAVASLLIGFGAYETDLHNLGLIAPLQDACTSHFYVWIPMLRHLPNHAWFVVSGVAAAAVFLVAAGTILVFSGASGGAEGKLKRLNENKDVHRAGFVS
jgi:hypothetical protein